MWLTKHEKEVLKLLLDDGKLSDTSMAEKLKISTQAIGRIRKRLEEDIIQGYTLNLDSKMLGLNIIAIIKFNIVNGKSETIQEIEDEIKVLPRVFFFLKTMSGDDGYILVSGYKNLEELEKTLSEKKNSKHFNDYCVVKEVITLPSTCVFKRSSVGLYKDLIDSCGVKHAEMAGGGNSDDERNNHRS